MQPRIYPLRPFMLPVIALSFFLTNVAFSQSSRRIVPPLETGKFQPYQSPFTCLPCHERQFRENRQSVKSGYRSFSPTFNSLELAGNYVAQGALQSGAIANNLRPVYTRANFATLDASTANNNNLRAGFCLGCHNAFTIGLGINATAPEAAPVEVPEWNGVFVTNPVNPTLTNVIAGSTTRPLRDFHYVDSNGNQVMPDDFGGPPPVGAKASLGGLGINCDYCHNVAGPDTERSLQGDNFGNNVTQLLFTSFKVGPFKNALPPKNNFHQSTNSDSRISYLRSPMLCNACHDVRVPARDIVTDESETFAPNIGHFRLENLSTEWAIGPYNQPTKNPFNQVVRCQDCHMSMYPYAGNSTYEVKDPVTGEALQVTSPTPAVFPVNFAAVPGVSVRGNIPLPRRKVVTHYFTGIDVPLLYDDELKTFLGDDYPAIAEPGVDEYGIPLALKTRREDLLKAAARIDLKQSDQQAHLGEHLNVRVRAIALTGHRYPAGFSQERGVWLQLTVSAKRKGTDEDFVLYQSGYLVDKAHPETNEFEADGSFHDEDQEHIEAIVNPFTHDNEVFAFGPDDGPHARIFEGKKEGLVFFRNELVRIYGPATINGRPTRIPAANRNHPRTNVPLTHILEEETFSAGQTNFVDNWRSLPPLYPRTYTYEIELPSEEELAELGVELEGPLQVNAAINFRHFPPLFQRFLARVGGAYVERNLHNSARLAPFVGLRGPANRFLHMWTEERLDDLVRTNRNTVSASMTVPLTESPAAESRWVRREVRR